MSSPTVTLGEVARYVNGFAFKSDDWGDQGLRIIRIQNLNDPTKPYNRTTRVVKDDLRVRQGDLLVSWSASLGVYEWTDTEDAWLNQHIFRVVPDEHRVDRRYLKRALESVLSSLGAKTQGATMKHLTRGVFLRTEIPLPSLKEQRRIASVLDAADALRAKRRESLAKLESLTQSIFIDMFGDPIANDRHWSLVKLKSVCERIQIGPFGSKLHQSDYVSGGIPLVNPMHIIDGAIMPDAEQTVAPDKCGELEGYLLEVDDVVMGRRGEMGRVAIVGALEAGFVCGSGSLFIRPDSERLRPRYLAAVLSSPQGRRRLEQSAQGVTMPNLNASIVQSFGLAVPPIAQQIKFESAVARNHQVQHLTSRHLDALDDLFASLQQRAFRGEL